ncbi:MAG: class I adenylate-forming enzyme family protein [Candidatus Dormibacteraceae bacterium]
MHLGWALAAAARRYPERPAITRGEEVLSYARWYRSVAELAGWLRQNGVGLGDRVAMSMRNREELARLYLAAQLAGAVAVPISFRFGPDELGYVLEDSGAQALFVDDSTADAGAALASGPRLLLHVDELSSAVAGTEPVAPPGNDDRPLSVILYTSGTTGRPKGVPRTHRAEYAASAGHVIQCELKTGERTLGAMPINHTMGIRALLSTLLLNGLYVPVGSVSDGPALDLLAEHEVSSLYLVPSAYHILLDRMEEAGTRFPHCRRLAYAGAPMPGVLVERCAGAFEPETFVNHYGSTEIYTFTTSHRQGQKPGCAGRPGFHTQVRLVRAALEERVAPDEEVAPGATGEVIVSIEGDEAFAGYLHRPDATAAVLRDGWYFTRDLGRLDTEGDLWVKGRVDDMINTGGENVHPLEIEEVLARHPEVAEVVVCGLPDERWGQAVTAFVVPRPGASLSAADLVAHTRTSPLAAYKRPRRVVIVRSIPKSPVGKILRRELQQGHYEEATA